MIKEYAFAYKALLSSVHKLPVELFCETLGWTRASQSKLSCLSVLVPGEICSHWHAIRQSRPELWTQVIMLNHYLNHALCYPRIAQLAPISSLSH
jgi:hypothetical protein